MLLLYYTSIVLLSLGFKASENGLDQNTDIYDRKYLPQYICIADCVQHLQQYQQQQQHQLFNKSKSYNGNHLLYSNVKFFKICARYCKQRNAFSRFANSSSIRRIQENFRLNLICRDDTSLNFRITFEKLATENDRQMDDDDIQFSNTYNKIYVIKMSKYSNIGEYHIYVSDEMFFTLDKLLPQTTYNITTMAVHSNGSYSIIAKQQLFSTLRKGYMPNNIKDIKVLKFSNQHKQQHLSATITWRPGRDMACFYDIICFSPERQQSDLEPLRIRNPKLLYTYNLHNLDFSTLYKVGIRAKSTKTSRESELYWKTFYTPSCVDWFNHNFNICAPLEPKNLSVEHIYVKQDVFALNISWSSPNYFPENYTLWIKDAGEKRETILRKYHLEKNATSFFIPAITLLTEMYEVNLTAFSKGGQASSIYSGFIKILINDQSCMIMTLSITILALFIIFILCTILMYNYHFHVKLKKKHRCGHMEEAQGSVMMESSLELKQVTSNSRNDALNIEDYKHPRPFNMFYEGTFALIRRDTLKDYKYALPVTLAKHYVFHQEFKNVKNYFNITSIIGYMAQLQKSIAPFTEYYYYDSLANYLRYENNNNNNAEIDGQFKLRQIGEFNQLNKRQIVNDAFEYEYYSPSPEMVDVTDQTISIYSTLNKPRHYQFRKYRKIYMRPAITTVDLSRINENYIFNELMPSCMIFKQVKVIDLIYMAKQVAMGQEFLIQHNIVHRDLDALINILISFHGAIKIADLK